MITAKNRITRRTLLRGAGGVGIGLPFLEAMLMPGQSHAALTVPLRFLVFYSPGGTLLDKWRPTGSETSFTLSDMMAPLNPFKDRLLFLDGLDMSVTSKGVGHPHSRGMAGVLTGTQLLPGDFDTGGGGASFADGPSVDQVIAGRISQGLKFPSLEYSSGWSISGRSAGEVSFAADQLTMAGSQKPIPPQTNALAAFNRVFGDLTGTAEQQAAAAARTKSILDTVADQYTSLSARLGSADRAKLAEHLDMIRQMEQSLTAPSGGPTCAIPTAPTGADGDPTNPMQGGTGVVVTAANVPIKGKVMTDLLVSSLACDLTRVATMQWADSEAKFILNFDPLDMPDHHHAYQHEKGFQPDALFKIYQWYAANFAYLLQKLDSVTEADGTTLLDNTLVLWVSEIQKPDDHSQSNMPFVLAGKAQGKLRTGRWLKVPSQPHNGLLVSLLNVFGGADTSFGDPDFNKGALAGLS
jgi:hypothetical protein